MKKKIKLVMIQLILHILLVFFKIFINFLDSDESINENQKINFANSITF